MNKKIRTVDIETPKGKRKLVFVPCPEPEEGKMVCEIKCAYYGVCHLLKDPTNPEDENSSFQEFCSNLGDEDDIEKNRPLGEYVPQEGTIEENLYDIDNVYQTLIKKDPHVKLSKVIDQVCSDNCPFYDEEHSQCSPDNAMCLLGDLLRNPTYEGQ